MSPYSETFLPRPSQMPTLLTESLFVNNDIELELLKRASVRQALAIAFYIGIAEYLNSRDYGVGYEVVAQPTTAIRSGRSADYTIRLTNRGNRPSSGWVLDLNAVPAVPYYDGSGTPGHLLGSQPVPDGLAPGASVDVHVPASAPPTAGQWLVKAGVRIPGDDRPYLLDRGVPILQMPLATR